ncbi:MAG: phenylalanine--tRNA ligase subunit beta [Gammaproteobacteria bacterium]|nr:phenylalanine--tRNA ligase subunit beta [Gammaproteobacteria bacterium]MCP5423981.1 phenylalanine--tRNA ligase subunit beta [Gammaproteobacteria bacterium]
MRFSEQWLREWVNPAISTTELANQVTMAGLEVDSVEPAAPPFKGVVMGRVVELSPHPTAERLQIAQVDIGQGSALTIVCGAPNVTVGMVAPVALEGAELPGDIHIKKTSLRGIESNGMLCSALELGLGESGEGLWALPDDSPLGVDLREWLGLDDCLIEIDLTPNRGDCLSISGIAREVGVLNRCELTPVSANPVEPDIDVTFPVVISAPHACPRYAGRVIRGLNPAATTPLWMIERLRRSGLRSLGPMVDITNYLMLELGQPMHAFDLDKLSGRIDVRYAVAGEKLELLNGNTIVPDAETLLITDANGPLALAGIMGGQSSAVGPDTRNVFLESAFFNPIIIAGRARRYGLHTDSSHRFERGVDPQLQKQALERATQLLTDIAGGQAGPIVEAAIPEALPAEPAIRLRPGRVERLLGLSIDPQEITDILRWLGMAVASEGDHWIVAPPSFRFDIRIEADLIEEIGRIYGYSRLPSHRPVIRSEMAPQPEAKLSLDRLRETLVQRGYQEAITYSFVDPASQQSLAPEQQTLSLANPISADLAVMRTSLWPGLLKAARNNLQRQQDRVRIFESGLCFIQAGDDLVQDAYLGGVICGDPLPEQWTNDKRALDFFDLKGDVESLLTLTGRLAAFNFVAARHPALQPGQSARIEHDHRVVGWLGAVHPRIAKQLDLTGKPFVFELRLADLQQARVPQFSELSRFPSSRRDIAIIVEEDVTAQAIRECIREHGADLLREILLFDVYRGKGVPDGHKSLAFGLILQDISRSLMDSELEKTVATIVTGLEKRFGAKLR